MTRSKIKGKQVVLTTAEIADIKRRVANHESLNSIGQDYGKFSVWTIRRAAAGDYDAVAISDNRKPLSDRQIQILLAWPTPIQAYEDQAIRRYRQDHPLLSRLPLAF